MGWVLGALCFVIILCVIALSVTLYNFMLLLSEINKRQVYVINDILQSIDLSTPHLDQLEPVRNIVEDIIEESKTDDNYFNPHAYDIDDYKENN